MLNQDEEGFFVLFFKQQQQQEVVFCHNKYVHIVENCSVFVMKQEVLFSNLRGVSWVLLAHTDGRRFTGYFDVDLGR